MDNIKNRYVQALRLLPAVLFAAFALQSGDLQGSDAAGADPAPSKSSEMAKELVRGADTIRPDLFLNPPSDVRPGAFWIWLNGSITMKQITVDLEAMKRAGMRGADIYDVAAYTDPDKQVEVGPAFMGPESTRLIAHAIREAGRLGLEIGMNGASGWNAGGTWITPEYAGKGIYQSTTTIAGPKAFHSELPLPELSEFCQVDKNGRPYYTRELAVLAVPHDKSKTIASADRVIDLTKKIDADGKLRWEVPEGEWDILRFVCMNHGYPLIVPSPNSCGPMIDFFDPRATEFHLNHLIPPLLKELGVKSFAGTSFKTISFDSMELEGFIPWTGNMADEFQRHAGYPIARFLPLLTGWKLADTDLQAKFMYDWQKLLGDLIIEAHYVTARGILGKYGLLLTAESGGPGPPRWDTNPVEGIKALGVVDVPRGECWIRKNGMFLIKEIASASHVYNKRIVDGEAFTTWRRWIDGPLNHKKIADRALCEGLNSFTIHALTSTPPEAGLPGRVYHAGTDINLSATWWPMVDGFMDYMSRCSYMLRQGWFVGDVCYYYGDQAPNFHPMECYVPAKPLLDGLDPRNDYDVCNTEVILTRMSVKDNRIVLPDGMSYAALILPEQDHIPSQVIEKIRTLVAEGATVIGHKRAIRAPGVNNNENETRKVQQAAAELWGTPAESDKTADDSVLIRPVGKGRFVIAKDRSKALKSIGVEPDLEIAGRTEGGLGPLDYIHRKTSDDEFYFICNKTNEPQKVTCRFRVPASVKGLVPEFWWPDSGRRSACASWKSAGIGQTDIPLELGPLGSVFVVFRKTRASKDEPIDPISRDTFKAAVNPAPLTLEGPWQVEFPEGWGAPKSATFEKLQSWTESDNQGIKYFSGIATYRKTFELPESMAKLDRLFLQLGDLAEIAEVTLNGKRLGLTWLPPFRIEMSGAVRAGKNDLEIRVANLWANRFNADSLLPVSERFTRSNIDRIQTDPLWDSAHGQVPRGKTRPVYTNLPTLMKSGIVGPVQIIAPDKGESK